MFISSDSRLKKMKIFILGAPSSGKTSIFNRIISQAFLPSEQEEVGFDIGYRTINIQSRQIKLQLWNTNGQERYFQLIKNFIASSKPNGIIIAYDITDMQSYKQVQAWINITYQVLSSQQVALMLVGNCLDLESQRVVSKFQPIKDYKFRYELDCMEISAKMGQNCEQMISTLAQRILGRLVEKYQEKEQIISNPQKPNHQDTQWVWGRPRFNEFNHRKRSIEIEMQTLHPSHLIYNPKTELWQRVQMPSSLGCS